MDLTQIIIGQVVTEKAEQLKSVARTYTLHVAAGATKIDVKKALQRFYDVKVSSVRVVNTGPKSRQFGRAQTMEKRHRMRRAMVTLTADSKALDLTAFKA
jgi:large subunit ribosomal protein L23